MTVDQHRGARRRLAESQPLSAQELAAARKLGREWREAWRAEQAGKANGAAARARPAERQVSAGQDFAAGIARAEFGRFYWNGKLAEQLAAAMTRRPKRDGKKPKLRKRLRARPLMSGCRRRSPMQAERDAEHRQRDSAQA